MTYCEGLGQINIARDPSAQIRAFQLAVQQRTAQPTTAVLIRPAPTQTTTFAPRPTPVLTLKPTTTVQKPAPVFKPTVVVSKPTLQTVGMKPAPAGSILTSTVDQFSSAFTKSPLPLIAIGLGALLLFNRKGR